MDKFHSPPYTCNKNVFIKNLFYMYIIGGEKSNLSKLNGKRELLT